MKLNIQFLSYTSHHSSALQPYADSGYSTGKCIEHFYHFKSSVREPSCRTVLCIYQYVKPSLINAILEPVKWIWLNLCHIDEETAPILIYALTLYSHIIHFTISDCFLALSLNWHSFLSFHCIFFCLLFKITVSCRWTTYSNALFCFQAFSKFLWGHAKKGLFPQSSKCFIHFYFYVVHVKQENMKRKSLVLVAFQMYDFSSYINLLYYKTIIYIDYHLTNIWGWNRFLNSYSIFLLHCSEASLRFKSKVWI